MFSELNYGSKIPSATSPGAVLIVGRFRAVESTREPILSLVIQLSSPSLHTPIRIPAGALVQLRTSDHTRHLRQQLTGLVMYTWWYVADTEDEIQGPYYSTQIVKWFEAGWLRPETRVARASQTAVWRCAPNTI